MSPTVEPSRVVVEQSDAPVVTIVVPVIREPERLRHCLLSALTVARNDNVTVALVVVLDGAMDDVHQFVTTEIDGATVLSWHERRGFAAALNAGIRAARTPFVAVLQDDTEVQPGWLRATLATAERFPRAGAVGSFVQFPDGSPQSAGFVVGGDGAVTLPWHGAPFDAAALQDVRAVDYASSSSMLVRRAAWAAVGGFDEEMYPLQYVDADFCTALWNAGWRVLCDPRSVVTHVRGGSSTTALKLLAGEHNRQRFLAKWGAFVNGRPQWLATAPTRDEVVQQVARARSWLAHPPPVTQRAEVGEPVAAATEVYARRERELQLRYVASRQADLAQ